jgi:CHAT domain-containing protein
LGRARLAADQTSEARILTWLGLASWRKGDYAEARRNGESALSLKLRLHLDADLFKSYNALGLLAWNEGRLTDAVTLFDRAMLAAQASKDREGMGKASGNLALVYGEMGEFAKAGQGFEVMRRAGAELHDARIEGNALNNLAMLRIKLGEPSSAIPFLLEARRLYHSIDYGNGEQNSLGQLGTAYAALGDPKAAFAALDSALALSRAQGIRQEEASNLEIIAEFYRDAGDIPRAVRFYGDAQAIEKKLGLSIQGAANLRNTADIQAALGRLDVATALATAALRTHQTAKARSDEIRDLIFLAELSDRANRPRATAGYLDAAERLIARVGWRRARIELALERARIADRAGQPRAVLGALHSTEGDLLRAGQGLEWEALSLRARAYARLGSLDSAISTGRLAVAAVEGIRNRIGSGMLRSSYLSDREGAYLDLVNSLLRSGRAAEALEVSDNMRGRALQEHLVARDADSSGAVYSPMQALAEREAVLRRIDALVQRFEELDATAAAEADTMARVAAKGLSQKLAEAREQYETLVIRTEELGGSPSLLGGGKVRAAEIRDALLPGEALLEYLVTPDRLIVFVMTPSHLQVVETRLNAEDLLTRVRVTLGLLGTPVSTSAATDGVLRELHTALLSSATRAAIPNGITRLIIVPHSILSYVPFAALRNPATGRYLVEDFDVVRLPSAFALPALRANKDVGTSRVAFRKADLLAPFPAQLPGTQREVRTAAQSLRGAQTYVGQRADEPRLRNALAQEGIVHVATHGIMNPRNPMFSRIEVARGTSGKSSDDGRLEVHEVLQLRVRSPLVFLSGCETATGIAGATHWSRGEDYATLAQAFLYAGTRDVIATLWKIEDEGAATFAGRFYTHLRTASPSDALALTQREMIRDSRFGAPYHWASYTISGEGLSTAAMQNRRVASVQLR